MKNNTRKIQIKQQTKGGKATVFPDEVPVRFSSRPDVGRDFLTLSFEGDYAEVWRQVEKVSKKVLTYNERKFTFTGWNSDRNEAFFAAPHKRNADIATY
jgi:hypothetical protein